MSLTGIHNENEFYSHHYLAEIFTGDIQATLERWREQAEAASARTPYAELRALAPDYLRFRNEFALERRTGQRILKQREWFGRLLPALGYPCQPANHLLEDGSEVPILCAVGNAGPSTSPRLLVLGAYDPHGEGEDPLTLKPHRLQFHGEAPPPEAIVNETWNAIVTRRIFAQAHPPRWLLVLSWDGALLLERGKWTHNRALRFDFNEILSRREDATLKATAALLHRESLLPESGQSLLDGLDENSHKHAFGVSEDLKHALRESIELIGNEAIRHLREVSKERLYDRPDAALAHKLGLEALRYMYRLLFLFYIEARPILNYAPLNAEAYRLGYGLERLRDLEMARLTTEESRNGTHLHLSIEQLFRLIRKGHHADADLLSETGAAPPNGHPQLRDSHQRPLRRHQTRAGFLTTQPLTSRLVKRIYRLEADESSVEALRRYRCRAAPHEGVEHCLSFSGGQLDQDGHEADRLLRLVNPFFVLGKAELQHVRSTDAVVLAGVRVHRAYAVFEHVVRYGAADAVRLGQPCDRLEHRRQVP